MWFLQRKSMPRRWLKLALIISLVHVILVFCLFFVYCDGVSHLALVINQHTVRRDIEFRVAVETVKKPVISTTLKTGATTSAKKSTINKQTTVAQLTEKKVVPKKEIKKPAVPAKSVAEKKAEAAPKPVIAKNEINKTEKQLPNKVSDEVVAKSDSDNDHFDMLLGSNQNLKGFEQEFGALYEDIASHWSPPPGIPADCTCTITLVIDRQGVVTDMQVDSSSGMLVYDLAARAAVSELQFPRITWGKSMTITFTV